ncbi:carboxypeptidase-like regulatory domain-containing protein [Puia sp. P3]|uniref:carboxypeptidase-like regulatory domain-containing protein n=1 Tax=Puia sp. P3 TaxID=3423952 RepID=UPI003D66DACC
MRKFLSATLACLILASIANAQTQEVTGKIVDSTGAPISGATLKVKGSKTGASAAPDGSFKIKIPHGSTLIVSSVRIHPAGDRQRRHVPADGHPQRQQPDNERSRRNSHRYQPGKTGTRLRDPDHHRRPAQPHRLRQPPQRTQRKSQRPHRRQQAQATPAQAPISASAA